MKAALLTATLIALTQTAHAELATGEIFTHTFPNAYLCEIDGIPRAAQAAVDAAVKEAQKICADAEILGARILSVEPMFCKTWNSGFQAKAEVEFSCPQ